MPNNNLVQKQDNYVNYAKIILNEDLPEPCKEAHEDKLACFAELNARTYESMKADVSDEYDFVLDVGLVNSSFISGRTTRTNNEFKHYFTLGDIMYLIRFYKT